MRIRARAARLVVAVLSSAGLALTAVGNAGAAPLDQRSGVITWAETAGLPPSYIFPLDGSATAVDSNLTFLEPLFWLPLYWYGSNAHPSRTLNPKLSLAKPPTFSDNDKSMTITFNKYAWSTGAPVTSRDLSFWMNLMLNEKTNYLYYVPGGWMDHVASYSTPSPSTFVLNLSVSYNRTYLIDDVLSELFPIPQQAWDKTSASAPIGNYDETPAGAKRVYAYLNQQSRSLKTWDTNPLWQVVDGPWRIEPGSGFQTTGQLTVVPNTHYSGPDKPKVAQFQELPFTSTSSEFDALRSGTIDYGYLPLTDLGQIHTLESEGYKIAPSYASSLTYITINYSNPRYGPLVGQLYIRQAMQMLINEPQYVKTVLGGYGRLTYGPLYAPRSSPSSASGRAHPPYPYDPAKAERLLESHGWSVPAHGVAKCVKPGTGPHRCGKGIADHTPLDIPLTYASGIPVLAEESQAMQASFGAAGIKLLLKEEPSTTVIDDSYDCHGEPMAKCSAHSPTLSYWASPSYTYGPTYFPGTTLFVCHDSTNDGNYCNPTVTALAKKVLTESTSAAAATLRRLDQLLAKQLPDLWMPSAPAEIAAISSKLAGAYPEGTNEYFYPQTWSLKS